MENQRRKFIKNAGLGSLGMTQIPWINSFQRNKGQELQPVFNDLPAEDLSIIGPYGHWAAGLTDKNLPQFSFRNPSWSGLEEWRSAAREKLIDRLGIPDIGGVPAVTVKKKI